MKNFKTFCIFLMVTLILSVVLPITGKAYNHSRSNFSDKPSCSGQAASFIGNPAASYCVDVMGYEHQVLVQDDGSEKGQCIMPTGDVCGQWEFYAGECGVQHAYCAQIGMTLETRSDGQDPYSQNYAVCVGENGQSQVQISELIQFDIIPLEAPVSENDLRLDVSPNLSEATIASLPSHFDWRNINGNDWMTPVKDQGQCGSCWAFSAIGIVEPYYNFLYDQPNLNLNLSEENLVSDCFNQGDCGGGHSHNALFYVRDTGIVDEACMPYTATNSSCDTMCSNPTRYFIDDFEYNFSPVNIETLKYYLVNYGPVSVYLTMSGEFGSDGIYRCSSIDVDYLHAVVVVGYNDPGQYWIVKNSWGSDTYGHDQGYLNVGYNQCDVNNRFYAYIPKPEETEINIAVTTPGWDNIGAILTNMGYSWTQISDEDLTSYSNISQYNVIFANCNSSASGYASSAAASIRQFVQDGGSLYASDYAFAYIQQAFPGHINFYEGPYIGESGYVTANIVDQGLANYLNPSDPPSTIGLNYDLGGWVPIDSVASGTTVHLRGSFSTSIGQQTNKPLVASFSPYTNSSGRVIYTSFHNEPQLTDLQEKMLEYLVLIPKTSDIVSQAENLVKSQGVYVKQTNINTINAGEMSARVTYNLIEHSKLVFGINWSGSMLNLSVYRPNGSFYGQVEGSSPPYLISIENAEPGLWQYEVEGIDVPYNNYPYVVVIGDELAEIGDHTLFLPLIMNNAESSAFNIRPVLTGPADGAVLNTLIPTFSWQVDSSLHPSTWLYYWISTDPNFSNYSMGVRSAFEGSFNTHWNLSESTTYYWYTAYDYLTDSGWQIGPFSEIRSFTTGSGGTILLKPNLVSPANGTNPISLPVILDWDPVSGAVEYQVRVWFEYDPPYWAYYLMRTYDTQIEMPYWYFDSNTYYEWEVIARNNYAWGEVSNRWNFTTGIVSGSASLTEQKKFDNLFIEIGEEEFIPFSEYEAQRQGEER